MHIVFTGSSILKIYKSNADLSRRAINYYLPGLSFREFLLFEQKLDIPAISMQDILEHHSSITEEITAKIKIFPEFKKYLEYGYYPFYKEGIKLYSVRLQNIVNAVLENDLPAIENVEYTTIRKIKKLLMIISSLVPYTPNINKLSSEIESNRANTVRYLDYLQKAGLIKGFLSSSKGMGLMNRPDKIYLDNTNLLYALTQSNVNTGNIRETFFAGQLSVSHMLNTSPKGDFLLNNKQIFEIGGSGKNFNQIKDLTDSYIAMDEIENGHGNKIPLWLFGFTY
jgi:predicted AAA+ superfamily ATPase